MINIKIICIGKMKEKSMKEVLDEYIKKLSKFARLDIIELADEKIPDNAKTAEISKIKEIESKKILDTIDKIGKTYVFACDPNGKQLNSIEFADTIESSLLLNSTLTFVTPKLTIGAVSKILRLSTLYPFLCNSFLSDINNKTYPY